MSGKGATMQTNNKLREAVVEIIDYLEPIRKWTMPSKENHTKLTALFAAVDTVYTKAKNALAAPPRNCDVGTATEQIKRYEAYCKAHTKPGGCTGCPLIQYRRCQIAWTQLPYVEKEGGAK